MNDVEIESFHEDEIRRMTREFFGGSWTFMVEALALAGFELADAVVVSLQEFLPFGRRRVALVLADGRVLEACASPSDAQLTTRLFDSAVEVAVIYPLALSA